MTNETQRLRAPTSYEPPLLTWEEYLPWALANEFPSEWVDGRIVDVVPQNLRSNLMIQHLHELLGNHVDPEQRGLLMFSFLMRLPQQLSGRVPDLMFIANEHMDRVTDTYLNGPADLVIEVVSLDSLVRDRRDKFLEYQAAGVREYWLIDEYHEEARFFVLHENGEFQEASLTQDGMYASSVLPGLKLPAQTLWDDPFTSFREALADGSPDPTAPACCSSRAEGVSPRDDHGVRSAQVTIETNGRSAPGIYSPPRVSWEDFHDWVLGIEGRAEWVDGEIVEIVGDSIRHYLLVHFLAMLISRHVERQDLGRVFIETVLLKLSSCPTGRMPDAFFVASEHRDRIKDTFVDGPADLVMEVVSQDSEVRDRFLKLGEYESAGIAEYWLIDHRRREAHFYVLREDGRYQDAPLPETGVFEAAVLPGLRLKVEWLWRDPLPTLDEALAELG